jgi:hypothetical protein
MATNLNSFGFWAETRNALVAAVGATSQFLVDEPTSDDPNSGYRLAKAEMKRLLDALERLAILGLKQIDDEIAASNLVKDLDAFSKEAKEEADRLKNAAKTIQEIADVVGKITGVVTKIAGLPFL